MEIGENELQDDGSLNMNQQNGSDLGPITEEPNANGAIVEGPEGTDGAGWKLWPGGPGLLPGYLSSGDSGRAGWPLLLAPPNEPWERINLFKWEQLLEIFGGRALVVVRCQMTDGKLKTDISAVKLNHIFSVLNVGRRSIDVVFYAPFSVGASLSTRYIEASLDEVDVAISDQGEARVRVMLKERGNRPLPPGDDIIPEEETASSGEA